MLAKFRHPGIILLMGVVSRRDNLCIVTELIEHGSLFELLHRRKALSESQKEKVLWQLAQVLAYLHAHGVVHRDIKSHNVMVTAQADIKLIDFGLCRKTVPC
jgi:serine/threonine protein kinase